MLKKSVIFAFVFVAVFSVFNIARADSISINLGAMQTENRTVILNLGAPSGTTSMMISNKSDLSDAKIEKFSQIKLWDICLGLPSCDLGTHTVYASFSNSGQTGAVVNGSIKYISKTANSPAVSLNRILKVGAIGEDVRLLQTYLNAKGFLVAESGPGSPGQESQYFGVKTKIALVKFQEAHAAEILVPVGLSIGSGIMGPMTINFINNNL